MIALDWAFRTEHIGQESPKGFRSPLDYDGTLPDVSVQLIQSVGLRG